MKKLIAAMAIVPMIALGASTATSAEEEASGEMGMNRCECPPQLSDVSRKLLVGLRDSAILLAAKGCEEAFGEGWVAYTAIGGRFPLAAGMDTGDEGRGSGPAYTQGDQGGEYQFTIPMHRHKYRAWPHDEENGTLRKTREKSADKSHNNMPPYLVLNFCHYDPPSHDVAVPMSVLDGAALAEDGSDDIAGKMDWTDDRASCEYYGKFYPMFHEADMNDDGQANTCVCVFMPALMPDRRTELQWSCHWDPPLDR